MGGGTKVSNGWEDDKRWSDRFLLEIKSILGAHLIAEPPVEEDAERNTDLTVLRMDAVRVACRVRKNTWLQRYGDEFTVRAGRPSGNKTELTKILEGWGNYIFYGFCDGSETRLDRWVLGDLNAFRIWFNRYTCKTGNPPGFDKKNRDGSSTLRVFNVYEIPGFVIAENRRYCEHDPVA